MKSPSPLPYFKNFLTLDHDTQKHNLISTKCDDIRAKTVAANYAKPKTNEQNHSSITTINNRIHFL